RTPACRRSRRRRLRTGPWHTAAPPADEAPSAHQHLDRRGRWCFTGGTCMEQQYDVVVIGTGSAAAIVASRCRAVGRTVAIIDARPFGGTCALRGCHPKKMLVSAGEALDAVQRMTGKGIRAAEVGIDWAALMRFKRTDTDPAPAFFEQSFAQAGIEAFHGRARFVGPTAVAVGDVVLHG